MTLFVALDGGDADNGCSVESRPCRTIGHALAEALEGLPDHGGPRVGVLGQRLEPGADVGDGLRGQEALAGDAALGDDDER